MDVGWGGVPRMSLSDTALRYINENVRVRVSSVHAKEQIILSYYRRRLIFLLGDTSGVGELWKKRYKALYSNDTATASFYLVERLQTRQG